MPELENKNAAANPMEGSTPEVKPEVKPEVSNPENADDSKKPEMSIEEQFLQLRLENEKLKKAQEKAATEAADYKKKYNSTLSEQQKAAMEKMEADAKRQEEYENLKKENAVNKLEKQFLQLGYGDLSAKAAEAQYTNDTDELFRIQQSVMDAKIKAKEAEWIKSRPTVSSTAGTGSDSDPFLKGFNE